MKTHSILATVLAACTAPAFAGDNPLTLSSNISWSATIGDLLDSSSSTGSYAYFELSDSARYRTSTFAQGSFTTFDPNQTGADEFSFYSAVFNGAAAATATQFLTVTFVQDVILGDLNRSSLGIGSIEVMSGPSFAGLSLNLDFIGSTFNAGTYTFRYTADLPSAGVAEDGLGLAFYGTAVPAPGAVALLGLAGLAGRRRR